MKGFKVGDRVVVKDNGGSFTTYRDFFKQNNLEQWEWLYAVNKSIPEGKEYKIVATGVHEHVAEYGTLYVLQAENREIYIGSNDCDYMELVKEDGKMYASELMELARKEPEKYEGKRYRVLGLCCIGPERQHYSTVIVDSEGKLQGKGYDNWAYINSNTTVEEIPPEPKPVTFMEAAEANENGKTVECKIYGCFNVYRPHMTAGMIDQSGRAVSANEILHGKWYIIGKEG